jgi:hypothetical protein
LSGARDLDTGLWRINLRKEYQQTHLAVANNVYELCNTGALVNYLHKAMFSPKKSALLQAVKNGHLVTWPSLTEKAINKHLKLTPATTMGNMNQRRQNIRSTSKTPITSGEMSLQFGFFFYLFFLNTFSKNKSTILYKIIGFVLVF